MRHIVRSINSAIKSLRLYPAYNPIPMAAVERAWTAITDALKSEGELSFRITRDALLYRDDPVREVGDAAEQLRSFLQDMLARGVRGFIFFAGITEKELTSFLRVLAEDPANVRQRGGVVKALEYEDLTHILVTEVPKRVAFDDGEAAPIETAELKQGNDIFSFFEQLVMKAEVSPQEKQLITHLASSPNDLTTILSYLSQRGREEGAFNLGLVTQALKKFHDVLKSEGPARGMTKNLADAATALDAPLPAQLIMHLLEQAPRDRVSCILIEGFDPGALADALVTDSTRGGPDLATIGQAVGRSPLDDEARDAIRTAFESLLSQHGYPEDEQAMFLECLSSPGAVSEAEGLRSFEDEGEDSGNVAPPIISRATGGSVVPEEILSSRDAQLISVMLTEAESYSSNEAIVRAYVNVISLASDAVDSQASIAALAKLLHRLIDEGHFGVVNDAMETIKRVTEEKRVSETIATRLSALLKELSLQRTVMRAFETLSVAKKGSTEYRDTIRFLTNLPRGDTIGSLIEILGTEELISRRKLLLSLISHLSQNNLDEIAKRIEDPRWFLVRNMVTVFAMIGQEEAFPYLERTLAHEDFRVKKETIKALGMIGGSRAFDLLLSTMHDRDEAVRELAIRSIGRTQDPRAIPILKEILDQRDPFYANRKLKIAAIAALGQIGSGLANAILEPFATKRSLFFRNRVRELSEAARDALALIAQHGTPMEESTLLLEEPTDTDTVTEVSV